MDNMIYVGKMLGIIVIFLLITCDLRGAAFHLDTQSSNKITYSRQDLLSLRGSATHGLTPLDVIPADILCKPRKRGRRGGARARLRRRPFKPPLPSVVMANVQSLRNKMDILHARCQGEKSFREACIIALSETWLKDSIPDEEVRLDNFTIIRADRTSDSGKERGGGVCVYVNDRWCNNIKTHDRVCTPDIEMLTVSLRPYYLPREFSTLVISCVYIPPGANTNAAAELAAQNVHVMLNKYPGAPVFIMGDFNSCKLDSVLPSFEQYVDSPTRKNNVLDLCYGNINNAYTARVQPPLGSADHNIVFLLPQYRQLLKREKPVTYSITQWTEDITAQLQGSFACTDWSIFDGDLDKKRR